MNRRHVAACVTLLTVGPASTLGAQVEFFETGNRLYQEGDYGAAWENYQRIRESGYESGALYYNMGNALFKLGRLGPAILHYERALRFLPGDEDVLANLRLAQSLTVDEITPVPAFWLVRASRWWVGLWSDSALRTLVLSAYLLVAVGLMLWILGRGDRVIRVGRLGAALAGIVLLVFGVNLVARELGVGRAPRGVVMAEEVPVYSAPAASDDLRIFSIHEGTTVRLDRRADDWVEIVLADGKVGWVPLEPIEII